MIHKTFLSTMKKVDRVRALVDKNTATMGAGEGSSFVQLALRRNVDHEPSSETSPALARSVLSDIAGEHTSKLLSATRAPPAQETIKKRS